MDDLRLALALREEEFCLRERFQGLDDPETSHAGRLLASLYAQQARVSEAIDLRLRIAQANPTLDLNDSQQVAFFLLWQGDTDTYRAFCQQLLVAAADSQEPKTARDTAKAILIHSDSDRQSTEAANELAERAFRVTRKNPWSVLIVGMACYRHGDMDKASEYLQRATQSDSVRLRLLGQLYLAMVRQQQGARDEAQALLRETEETFGPIAVVELQSPFTIHHDDLAVWLALQEARQFIRNGECINVP
jgi:tetratricopeptide (TPR) repeat protein